MADVEKERPDPHYYRNFFGFLFLGVINNLGYVVVNSAAKTISSNFNMQRYLGAIPWANVFFGIFARALNTFYMEGTSVKARIGATGLFFLVGIVGVAISVFIDFWFAVASILFVGIGSAFGESVCLSNMRLYPATTVGGWSSGTGVAGITGSGLWLLFQSFDLTILVSFMAVAPTAAIYVLVFYYMLIPPTQQTPVVVVEPGIQEKESLIAAVHRQTTSAKQAALVETVAPEEVIVEKYWARVVRCFKMVWWRAFQLLLVYMFEYIASSGAAAKSVPASASTSTNFFEKNSYAVLAFSYQLGVFISRSSLKIVRIQRIEVLTVLQGINVVLWIMTDIYKFMSIGWQITAMVYCGLLGGAMYVNTFYLILHDSKIRESDRELCVNLTALSINLGITLASVFILIMDSTFLLNY